MLTSLLKKFITWYESRERLLSSLSLIGGFVFDAITLQRVDEFWENVWVIAHILGAAICIIIINRRGQPKTSEELDMKHFWLLMTMQFMFGGLLSTFLVFYYRSASLLVSWPFILILIIAFAANERLRKHYERVTFQISFLYLSLFSFAIFIVPVLTHQIGKSIFLLSGLLSLIALYGFLIILRRFAPSAFEESKRLLAISIFGIWMTFHFLYFFNIIPPLPLALKDSGMYHTLQKNSDGSYIGTKEKESWTRLFKIYEDFHATAGQTLYAYSAIFSPTNLNTGVVHEWQFYDEARSAWITQSTISLRVVGGREDGYRTYSQKSLYAEGKWRVNVQTSGGQTIGRIYFNIIEVAVAPELLMVVKS